MTFGPHIPVRAIFLLKTSAERVRWKSSRSPHCLVAFCGQVTMLRVFVDDSLALHMRRELTPERAAMVKLNATALQNRLLDEFL